MNVAGNATNVEKTLEKVLDGLSCSGDVYTKIDLLKKTAEDVLPDIPLHKLEVQLFSKLVPEVNSLVENIINSIRTGVSSSRSRHSLESVTALLKASLTLLECLGNFLQHLKQSQDDILMSYIHSLPSCILFSAKTFYLHCKDSAALYDDMFPSVSADLSVLFKKIFQLQKLLMEVMEQVILPTDCSEQDVIDMTEVCHEFLDVCSIVGEMDLGIMVNTWKIINRLVTKHKILILNHLQVDRLLNELCACVEVRFHQCLQLGAVSFDADNNESAIVDEKTLSKIMKIVRFFIGNLLHIVKEYDGLFAKKSFKDLLHLILVIQSLVPPSLSAPCAAKAVQQDFASSVVIGVEPLIMILIKHKHFADILTACIPDVAENCRFPLLLVQLLVLKQSPTFEDSTRQYWAQPQNNPEDEPRLSILEAVFQSLKYCYVELCFPVYVPGIMCNGKPQRDVSLYEYAVTCVGSFIATAPAESLEQVEKCLLKQVLGTGWFPALLATDVWCFMARWGCADLCYEHVNFLSELFISLCDNEEEPAYSHLATLIQRLVTFLAPQHQDELVASRPPSKSSHLRWYSIIPVHKLNNNARSKVCRCLAQLCIKVCNIWSSQGSPPSSSKLVNCLQCLHNIYRHPELVQIIPPVHHSAVVETIKNMWEKVAQDIDQIDDVPMSHLVTVSSSILPHLHSTDYAKILEVLKLFVMKKTLNICLIFSILHFLGVCGKKQVTQAMEEGVFGNLSVMFTHLMSSKDWLVYHKALEAAKIFASDTPYTHIVQDFIPDGGLPYLQDFLNEVPYKNEASVGTKNEQQQKIEIIDVLKQQIPADIATESGQHSVPNVEDCLDDDKDSVEYPPLPRDKVKLDSCKELSDDKQIKIDEAYKGIITGLEKQLHSLAQTLVLSPVPSWAVPKLNELHQLLSNCIHTPDKQEHT